MPLRGIRVIEWTTRLQGPVACDTLGALGADVIKIEEPGKGDSTRGSVRFMGVPQQLADGSTAHYEGHNRNKRGITLNLRKPAGREIACRLIEKADVFVHNQRKGVAERLGLGYETLAQVNPRLIYAQGWGLGPAGPHSHLPTLDGIAQARAGMLLPWQIDDREPLQPVSSTVDDTSAMMLAFAIVTALLARERLGLGQKVDASLLGSGMRQIRQQIADYYITGRATPRPPRDSMTNPLYNEYKCSDGKWIILGLYQGERFWAELCRVLNLPRLAADPRFADYGKRQEHCVELCSILRTVFATKSYQEWDTALREGGDFVYGPLSTIPELADDPQVTENNYLVDFDDPVYGRIKVPGLPFHLGKTPWSIRRRAPGLGEHTEEVLIEVLDYDWDKIAALNQEGVI